MRIALLTTSYPRYPGDGAAPFIQEIAHGLAALDHDVEVLAPYDPLVQPDPGQGVRVNRFRYIWRDDWHIMGHARALEADIRLRPLAYFLLPSFLVSATANLLRQIDRQQPDLIYAHWVIPNGIPALWAARKRALPVVITLHGSDIFIAQRNILFRAITRWIFHHTDAVTTNSPDLMEAAVTLGAPDTRQLLPLGVDPVRFCPQLRTPENRQNWGWSSKDIVIAALGRFVHKKGFATLIAALPPVLTRFPNVVLSIAGSGPLLDDLSSEARRLGIENRLLFPGQIPWNRVPSYLACADIFALPSVKDHYGNMDGLPCVLLEAMSCGTAVVASHLGGVGLAVEHQKSGLLVPPGDVDALSRALIDLIEHPDKRASLGLMARKAVEEQLNWECFSTRISSVLDQALRAHRRYQKR